MINHAADWVTRHASPDRFAWLHRNTPERILQGLRLHRFQKLVRWAGERSPFYKKAFAERGIDPRQIRTPADLGDFFTTPDDIVRDAKLFLCSEPAIVFESSGTSGKNKQVYFDRDELTEMGKIVASGFRMMGMRDDDVVANAFDFSIWIPGLLTHNGVMAHKAFVQAFGKVDPIEVYRRMADYKYTVVLGEPTWLIRLTELAEKHGSYPLRLLIGGAEEMPDDAVPWMQRVWQGATVKMCYGSVEMGTSFGFQPCDRRDGYHVDDVNFFPEIIEADEDGYGELVLSTIARHTMPLIRYRTRDVTKLDYTPCACGNRSPRIARLRGRRDELIVASGGNLYPLMFENILKPVEGISHDWQVIFTLEGVREVLEVNIETDRTDVDRLSEEIRQQMTYQYPDLMKNLALGIFELRISTRPAGSIRNGARKLKRMLDRRDYAGSSAPRPVATEPAMAVPQ